jgi:hypothetical protein
MQFFMKPAMQQVPWNKGKLIGQKPPLQLKHVWAIRTILRLDGHIRDLASRMLPRMVIQLIGRRYDKRKQADLSNLKFRTTRAKPSTTISRQRERYRVIFCSRVVAAMIDVSRPDSMPALFRIGLH